MKKIIGLLFLFISLNCFSQNDLALAERYYADGQFEKATQLYKNLYNRNPNNTTYLKRLVSCYQETNQFETAKNLLINKMNTMPIFTYLNVELGYNFEKQKQPKQATVYYDKAIASIDGTSGMGPYIAMLFKEKSLLDYALLAYEKTMQKNPNTNYQFQIAQIYGEKGLFEKMFQSYIDLLGKNENFLSNIQRHISKYITEESTNKNNILLRKIVIKKSMSNPKNSWNQLLSWLFIQQKDYEKAWIQNKALYARNPKFITRILNLGNITFDNKQFTVAKKCFQFIRDNSQFTDQKLYATLKLLHIQIENKLPEVEASFTTVLDTFGYNSATLKIQLAFADYLTFHKGDSAKAIAILEKALQVSKTKYEKGEVKLKLGEIYVFSGRFNKALIYFSQVQTSIKNHPLAQQARFKVAQTSFFKSDFKWAFAQLKVLKASTTQLIANDALELFLIISDNQSKDSLETGLKLYAKANLFAFQNKNEQAIDSFQKIIVNFKGQKIEDEALYKQGNLFVKVKKHQQAIDNFTKIIALNKDGIFVDDALFQIAEIYRLQLNNPEKASDYYQKIIFEHPSSIYLVASRKNYRKLRGDTIN